MYDTNDLVTLVHNGQAGMGRCQLAEVVCIHGQMAITGIIHMSFFFPLLLGCHPKLIVRAVFYFFTRII